MLYHCRGCNKKAVFDPADLIVLYGDQDAMQPAFACSRCGHARHISIGLFDPAVSTYGQMYIRKPGKLKQVQTWQTVRIGSPNK